MKALILAAGQGTRLRQLSGGRPKPMLPIRGKPLLQHIVHWLLAHGIRDIAINVHYRPAAITEHFGDGSCFGAAITYSYEEKLMGTAGAAKRLASFLDEEFVIVYGDVLTNLDLARLIALHSRRQGQEMPAITFALYSVPEPTQCGLVAINETGRVTRFVEKPPPDQVFTDLAFGGILIAEPGILDWIPPATVFDFGHDLIPLLLAAGIPMYGQKIATDEYLIDIGTLSGYLAALRTYPAQHSSNCP